jgi:hypothetical protein
MELSIRQKQRAQRNRLRRFNPTKSEIEIETAEVVENNGIKPADLKKAVDAVKQYKADMIREWKAYFGEEE